MSDRMSRRGFLKGAAAGAGLIVLANPWSARSYAQNAKVRFANVGVGGRGGGHLGWASAEELAAVCDADRDTVDKVAAKYPGAKKFDDWRKMFDEMLAKIDGVVCATPDHTHFPVAYTAVKNKKHCYCEKPLTHGIWEARTLAQITKQNKVATQMGNQGHANEGNRRVVEWVRAGVIGEVKEIHTWTNRPIWPQGKLGPFQEAPEPATLNWDAWLGVAPKRAYFVDDKGASPVHRFKWRGWFDYGCGAVGDMGCHTWDCVWWSMDPRAPLSCEPVKAVELGTETWPKQMVVRWEFGPSAADSPYKRPGFAAYWYEGGLKPEVPQEMLDDPALKDGAPPQEADAKAPKGKKKAKEGGSKGPQLPGSGSLFIGTKGKLLVEGDYGNSPHLIPTAVMNEFKKNMPPRMEGSPGHQAEFVMGARGEKPWDFPKSNFTYGGPLVEAMLLGNVTVRLGKKVQWDPQNLKCPGCPQADLLIKREYRKEFWQFA
jgi:predicted dehydrogenase